MRKKMVRMHLKENAPSCEGILVAKRAGFYKLEKPVLLAEEGKSLEMDGQMWVPIENVLFVQVIG